MSTICKHVARHDLFKSDDQRAWAKFIFSFNLSGSTDVINWNPFLSPEHSLPPCAQRECISSGGFRRAWKWSAAKCQARPTRHCPTTPNVVWKLKLQIYTEPRHWLCTLLPAVFIQSTSPLSSLSSTCHSLLQGNFSVRRKLCWSRLSLLWSPLKYKCRLQWVV